MNLKIITTIERLKPGAVSVRVEAQVEIEQIVYPRVETMNNPRRQWQNKVWI